MPLTRLPLWDTRLLHDYVIARARMPFRYGSNDCCTFAAGAIRAMTGTDVAADFGSYRTAQGAQRAIRRVTRTGSTVADALEYVAAKYGLDPRVTALHAQRGDLALVEIEGYPVAGIVSLTGRDVLVPGDEGLYTRPIAEVRKAWRI